MQLRKKQKPIYSVPDCSAGRTAAARQEVGIGAGEALMQSDLWRPAELFDFRYVEQLLRRAVRARRIKLDLALVADDLCDLGSEVGDSDVFPGPDIEKA